ncbi:MAG: transposase [Candidatus Poribacteria bacterium]|nr:transposase [Candidatus Poribacteria bacterium]
MAKSRYKIMENQQPYFLTCTVVNWLPIFTRPETVQIVLDAFRYLQAHKRLTLYGFVILENHLHFIADADNLSKEVANFKSFTARKIIDFLEQKKATTLLKQLAFGKLRHKTDRRYQLWQEGSHPQLIQGEEIMRQKLEYIHYNPVKRGYVDDPTHWRCSSARNYGGEAGVLEVCTAW